MLPAVHASSLHPAGRVVHGTRGSVCLDCARHALAVEPLACKTVAYLHELHAVLTADGGLAYAVATAQPRQLPTLFAARLTRCGGGDSDVAHAVMAVSLVLAQADGETRGALGEAVSVQLLACASPPVALWHALRALNVAETGAPVLGRQPGAVLCAAAHGLRGADAQSAGAPAALLVTLFDRYGRGFVEDCSAVCGPALVPAVVGALTKWPRLPEVATPCLTILHALTAAGLLDVTHPCIDDAPAAHAPARRHGQAAQPLAEAVKVRAAQALTV